MGHAHDAQATTGPAEHDPAHDVDGKKLTLWLVGCTIGIFGTVFILLILFEQIIEHQRNKVVGLAPTPQRDSLRQAEDADLAGRSGGKNVDQAIKDYVQKHGGKPATGR
jgi:hypothetical protein